MLGQKPHQVLGIARGVGRAHRHFAAIACRLGAHGVMAPAQRESGHAERRARSHPAICRAISSSFAWKVSPHRAQACASERKPYA